MNPSIQVGTLATYVAATIATSWSLPSAVAAQPPQVSNQIVLLVDSSGSYRARQEEAITRATALLDGLATRDRRWERATDRVTVINLDAMPDVLWQGTLRNLKDSDRNDWVARFRARRDYASCTDVGAAFRLAARNLDGDPATTDKYLFAFTDLVDEPPARTLRSCRRRARPSLPSADFPWEELRTVSVAVFWVPPAQTLAWRRAVADQGLDATFAVHSDSESADVTIRPPPRAVVETTDVHRAARRERVVDAAWSVGRWALAAFGVLVGLVVAMLLAGWLVRRLRRRGPSATNRRPPNAPLRTHRPSPGGAHRPPLRPAALRPIPPRTH